MLEVITGVVRHVLTFGGGFLIEDGIATGDQIQTGISAFVTLIGLAWSIYEKIKDK
jgi:hypothetical protein